MTHEETSELQKRNKVGPETRIYFKKLNNQNTINEKRKMTEKEKCNKNFEQTVIYI